MAGPIPLTFLRSEGSEYGRFSMMRLANFSPIPGSRMSSWHAAVLGSITRPTSSGALPVAIASSSSSRRWSRRSSGSASQSVSDQSPTWQALEVPLDDKRISVLEYPWHRPVDFKKAPRAEIFIAEKTFVPSSCERF